MEMFRMEMTTVYFPNTVEEWMEENVNEYMDKLHSLARDVERIVQLKGQQKSRKTSWVYMYIWMLKMSLAGWKNKSIFSTPKSCNTVL